MKNFLLFYFSFLFHPQLGRNNKQALGVVGIKTVPTSLLQVTGAYSDQSRGGKFEEEEGMKSGY